MREHCENPGLLVYFVTCSFDLKGASATDYQNAYSDLAKLGLRRTIVAEGGGNVVAPTTMVMGEFSGPSAAAVRDGIRQKVKAAFQARRFTSEIFVTTGSDWAWGVATS